VLFLLKNVHQPQLFPLAYCQFIGCLIYGIAVHRKESWSKRWFAAMTVGFCGSLTSFSAWMIETFACLENQSYANAMPNLVSQILFTLVIGFGGYKFGAENGWFVVYPIAVNEISSKYYWVLSATLTMSSMAAVILACIFPDTALVSISLGPIGAMIRWGLSLMFNKKWPLGTLIANIVGTCIAAIVYNIDTVGWSPANANLMRGIIQGFCGN
jgi:fluoride ion exporter CrcB/FEX